LRARARIWQVAEDVFIFFEFLQEDFDGKLAVKGYSIYGDLFIFRRRFFPLSTACRKDWWQYFSSGKWYWPATKMIFNHTRDCIHLHTVAR